MGYFPTTIVKLVEDKGIQEGGVDYRNIYWGTNGKHVAVTFRNI